MYKAKHNLCPQHISDLFTSKNTRFNLRNADISIPGFNTVTYGKHSLRYLGAKLWSKLDAGVKSSATLEIFKSKIRKINIDFLMTENCRNRPFQGLFRYIAGGAKHWGERAAKPWLPYILLMSER